MVGKMAKEDAFSFTSKPAFDTDFQFTDETVTVAADASDDEKAAATAKEKKLNNIRKLFSVITQFVGANNITPTNFAVKATALNAALDKYLGGTSVAIFKDAVDEVAAKVATPTVMKKFKFFKKDMFYAFGSIINRAYAIDEEERDKIAELFGEMDGTSLSIEDDVVE